MVNDTEVTTAVFAALGDPTRQRLVRLLAAGDSSVSALAAQLPISLPGTMKHLDVLARAGVVRRTKSGRTVTVSLRPPALVEAEDWLRRQRTFWTSQLGQLADSFTEPLTADSSTGPDTPSPQELS